MLGSCASRLIQLVIHKAGAGSGRPVHSTQNPKSRNRTRHFRRLCFFGLVLFVSSARLTVDGAVGHRYLHHAHARST